MEEKKSDDISDASLLGKSSHTEQTIAKSNENLIVNSFVSFFEPLIHNLDSQVQSLRF